MSVNESGPETLSSRLVPDLFDLEKLEAGYCLRVLDLGPANSHTFSFLGRFNCRLQVVDVREKLLQMDADMAADPGLEAEEIGARLKEALDLKPGEVFDICLLWDFLNYLALPALPLLAELLLPHLAPGARLHGFAVLNRNTSLARQNYGVLDSEQLAVVERQEAELPFRHSQSAISDRMRGLAIKQSILRADGRLEMVLHPAR